MSIEVLNILVDEFLSYFETEKDELPENLRTPEKYMNFLKNSTESSFNEFIMDILKNKKTSNPWWITLLGIHLTEIQQNYKFAYYAQLGVLEFLEKKKENIHCVKHTPE